jgi:alkanesulfonate monooxygenase SsuD/methylene tetrahydromethanopterin reductase-like flavin-dependent oxidoreductase (luciferase family)
MTRTIAKPPLRLGYFTRLLDQADAAERYRLATAQIIHAERCGFDSAWVAQHHFHEDEGGLPAPFVFLSQVGARTTRIRLGTGIVTLPSSRSEWRRTLPYST